MEPSTLLPPLAYLLIALGLAGTVLPLVPGPLIIWLGALVWSWGNGFEGMDWLLLVVLGVLAVAAWGADLLFTTTFTRRAGVRWRSIGAAIVGGLVGGLFLSQIPVLGTIFGALIGALVGMWLAEYLDKRSVSRAFAAVRTYALGTFLSSALEFGLALLMVGIFVVRVVL